MARSAEGVTAEELLGALHSLYDAYDGGEGAKQQDAALESLKKKMGGRLRWDRLGRLTDGQQRGLRQALARQRARDVLTRAGRL
jgi:hypothetical protein